MDYPRSHARRRSRTLALGTLLSMSCGGTSPPSEPTSTSGSGPGSTTQAPPPSTTSSGVVSDTTAGPEDGTTVATSTASTGEPTTTGSGIKLDVGGGQGSNDVEMTGRVLAPNGQIPIAGAQVYLTTQPPAPIPDGVYCDECEVLGSGEYGTTTDPDGTFTLQADLATFESDPAYLVVKKGQFMRVETVMVQEGAQAVSEALTQLPGVHDPASGRWIPRIAVYDTWPDAVFNVLAKFGLGSVSANGTLIPGTEQFTLLSDADGGAFMDDLALMSQYHIIFVPCATTVFWPQSPTVSPERIQNIRDYVDAGGRWYATDHSNEYIKEPFPAYLDLHNPGMPDIQPAYTVNGTVVDPHMLAWLDALPPELKDIGGGNPTLNALPSVELRDNFSGIDAVHTVLVPDPSGGFVDVGPRVWVEGPCTSCANPAQARPMAISGQYGCGRMMYSTFETSSSAHQGLNPQELALLYVILEIGVCQDDLPPPPG